MLLSLKLNFRHINLLSFSLFYLRNNKIGVDKTSKRFRFGVKNPDSSAMLIKT